jgi:hypothetical protein
MVDDRTRSYTQFFKMELIPFANVLHIKVSPQQKTVQILFLQIKKKIC